MSTVMTGKAATQERENVKMIPKLSLREFNEAVNESPGLLEHQPCVVTGFVEQWEAFEKWRDHNYLAEKFGDYPVTAGAPQFTTHKDDRMCQVRTTFGRYLQYMRRPTQVEEIFDGQWVKGDASVLRELQRPLYCGNMRIVNNAKDEVFDDVTPIVPESVEVWNNLIPYYYQSGNHFWLYVSMGGALTPLHQDNNAVIAYLGQLEGQKEAILYNPGDKAHFYNPEFGYMDPLNPNDEQFPTWRKACRWEGTLSPGELLIWGPKWAHHVTTLTQSMSVSFDVVNELNLKDYTRSRDWRDHLGQFALKNSDLVRKRINRTELHDALDSGQPEGAGGEFMIAVLEDLLSRQPAGKASEIHRTMLEILNP